MRAHTTLRQTISRRIAAGFAVALLTSIFAMNATSLQAQDPEDVEDPGDVVLIYFDATPMGLDEWFVDGAVEASNLSSITVTMGGAASAIGTITPDAYGYFFFDLVALPYDKITADATDGTTTSSGVVELHDWY